MHLGGVKLESVCVVVGRGDLAPVEPGCAIDVPLPRLVDPRCEYK